MSGTPPVENWVHAAQEALAPGRGWVHSARHAAGVFGALTALLGIEGALRFVAGAAPAPSVPAPWTSATVVVLGLGLVVAAWGPTRLRRPAEVLAGVPVVLSGLASLVVTTARGRDLRGSAGEPLLATPTSVTTAVCLVVLGVALVLAGLGRIGRAQAAMVVPLSIGSVAALGHLLGAPELYAPTPLSRMSAEASAVAVLASVAVLGLRVDRGPMQLIVGTSAGGRVARRLAPVVLVLPAVIAAVSAHFYSTGVVGRAFVFALVVTTVTVAALVVVWREATRLGEVDIRRVGTEAALARIEESERAQAETAARLERANRQLSTILGSTSDAFILLDSAGVISGWNPAAERLYGYSAEEALGRRLGDLLEIYTLDREPFGKVVDGSHLETAIERGPDEYLVVRKNGERVEVESRVSPMELDGTRYYTAVVRDISRRISNERELVELNRSLDDFSAIAAHDLKGPLTTIRGYAEILVEETDAAGPAGLAAARIERAAVRGSALIDDLLAYSAAGRAQLAEEPVDLDELLAEVGDEVRAVEGREFDLVVGALPVVAGDHGMLRQVFVNLVANAVRYCPPDREPRVEVRASGGGRRETVLTVADNGAGVPASERESVFEMFHRGTTGRHRRGSGIGLAVSRRIVEHHGGRLTLDAGTGGGAEFTLELPPSAGGSSAGSSRILGLT